MLHIFHTQALESWYKLIGTEPKGQDDIAHQFIEHNQCIKINGKPINDQSLYNIKKKHIYGINNQILGINLHYVLDLSSKSVKSIDREEANPML